MMTTRHLVDPELLAGLELVPAFAFSADTLPAVRRQMADFAASRPAPSLPGVTIERRCVRAPAGHDVPVLIHRPDGLANDAPAVLYAHGGGYVIGSAAMMSPANQRTAIEAECVVVSVDYRLPPETPHPGPVEDCHAVLAWLHAEAAGLGIDPARIAVAGESAGAGLVAALALLARDRGGCPIVHQHLTYPMLDDRTGPGTASPYAGEFVWSAESNRFGWASLLGHAPGGDGVSPYAAAARATDLAGLPGAYIAVGSLDLFAEENLDYAKRLMRAGVPVELHLYPGAYHGFELAAEAGVTRAAHRDGLAALRRALGVGGNVTTQK